MSIPFVSPIDLGQNELQNARIQNLATAPGSPVAGLVYFDTALNALRWYNGTAWITGAALSTRLDQFAAPTSAVSMGSQSVTNVASPSASTDAATKGYVDSVALGLDVKASVRVATTAAGTLSTSFANGQTVDGITLTTGDRILVKNQSSAAENGIYVVTSGSPTRSPDTNSSTNYVSGSFTFVEQGTANAGSAWVVSTQGTITPGTTSVSWVQFAGGGTYSAGTGITLTGSTFSLNVSAAKTALGSVSKYAANVGDGSSTSIVVTHSLGTTDVVVEVAYVASPYQRVQCEVQHTSTNTITLLFGAAPASNALRCIVQG